MDKKELKKIIVEELKEKFVEFLKKNAENGSGYYSANLDTDTICFDGELQEDEIDKFIKNIANLKLSYEGKRIAEILESNCEAYSVCDKGGKILIETYSFVVSNKKKFGEIANQVMEIAKLPDNDFEVVAKGELLQDDIYGYMIGDYELGNLIIWNKYLGNQIEIGIRVIPDIENESKDQRRIW